MEYKRKRVAMTLDEIRGRCKVVGDCWLWTQAINGMGYPICRVIPGETSKSVRRHVALLAGKVSDKRTSKWYAVSSCDNKLCCSPKCVGIASPSKVVTESYATGIRDSGREYLARHNAAILRGQAVVTEEIVRAIRAIPLHAESNASISRRLNMSRSGVGKIRRGETWRHVAAVRNASVFSMGGA